MYEVVTIVSGSSDVSDEYYDCVDTFEEAKEIFESHCESCENFSAQAEDLIDVKLWKDERTAFRPYGGFEDIVLEQLKGSKKVYGREIYEGDLIRVEYFEKTIITVVKTDQFGDTVLENIKDENDTHDIFNVWYNPLLYRFIGNIHENGELLK